MGSSAAQRPGWRRLIQKQVDDFEEHRQTNLDSKQEDHDNQDFI